MTDYEYILQQVKKFHFSGWSDEELRKCVDMLPTLDRQELISLYRSRWLTEEKPLKDAIFQLLFKERIEERDRKIKAMNVDELIANGEAEEYDYDKHMGLKEKEIWTTKTR